MYKKILDYGLIGDTHSVALVSNDGSIDYCSMPHMDSPTVFALLLDDEKGGYFRIQPSDKFTSTHSYIENTNILKTHFKTGSGTAELTDFMPVSSDELFEKKDHAIHRLVKCISGSIKLKIDFYPKPGYAMTNATIESNNGIYSVKTDKETFTLKLEPNLNLQESSAEGGFTALAQLNKGETIQAGFYYGEKTSSETTSITFEKTRRFWLDWLKASLGDKDVVLKNHLAMINRSLLTLKLLTYQPTGAIAAAATTSLPETIGGERNWDYRFTWIRDASFTLKAMFALGHINEAGAFIRWLHDTYKKHASADLQIMYSLEGDSILTEITLSHLKGYRGSRPVRTGNGAYDQRQWDIYGEVMDTAMRLSDYAGKIDETLWPFFRDICELAVKNWRNPDEGIWEMRNGPFHFVYSKAMCWVALDRGIKIAKRYGFDAPLENWERELKKIKDDIVEKGFDRERSTFIQRYGSRELDSSLLLLGLMGFLPFGDKRIQGTIEACKSNLMKDGFLLRYTGSDGLEGEEGGFLLCNFWLIESLALSGRIDEAEDILKTTLKAASDLGLFAEEYDPAANEALGNFPQAFSHIGFINSTVAISNARKKKEKVTGAESLVNRMKRLVPLKTQLNGSTAANAAAPRDLSARLKKTLGTLQGAFFDVEEGRVDYHAMKRSGSFKEYLALVDNLPGFDLSLLKSDEAKKAFWINLYNILIIHGVIYFDINRSVKEVVRFFGRIGYNIGGFFFSPDDIEHGILRANRGNPSSGLRQFSGSDRRLTLSVNKPDPRIHFTLVCAASSCPPIEFYDPENIENQLETAGKSFLNRKGLVLDKSENSIHLSQIFKWYSQDFGDSERKVLEYALKYAKADVRSYINSNINSLSIDYLPYIWELNRTINK